jgi:hypothetical protein
MAGLASLSGRGFMPGLSGFNIPEIGGGFDPATSALGFGGLPQAENGAFPESNPYLKFFGMPMRNGRMVDAPAQNREHFDWAEAYDKASVPYVTAYTITELMESDSVLCRTVLPFHVTEDRIDIKWSEWHFRDAMLDPRPAETASRLLSCSYTQGSDTMQTMGRAIEMEDGFYKTPAGQMHFLMQWKQIVNATAMTLEFGAATALANVRQPGTSQTEQYRSGISPEQLRAIAIRECRLFNCMTTPGGLDIAIEHCLSILVSRGVTAQTADTVIVPGGSEKHVNDPTFKPFFLTGKPQPDHVDSEVRYKNKRIIMTRLHNVGGEGPPQDPHFRWVTTGTNYQSDHKLTWGMPADKYQTALRTEIIWNEDSDDYSHITLQHMLLYSGLFQPDDQSRWTSLSPLGVEFFKGCATIGDYYAIQGETLALSESHYRDAAVSAYAGQALTGDITRGVVAQLNREAYEEMAAHLNRVYGEGDEFFELQGYPQEYFFQSSRELIDAILDTPVTRIGHWFQWCMAAHVPVPVSFVLANPYQRWYAGMLQALKSGKDTGATFIGHFDVQAGRDFVRKMLGLHVTAMMKSIVVNPKLIANAPNVLVKGYDGGGGVRPWDPLDDEHMQNFQSGNTQNCDQFVFAVNRIKPYWCTDVCGVLNPSIVIDNETRNIETEIKDSGDEAKRDSDSRLLALGQARLNDAFLRTAIQLEQRRAGSAEYEASEPKQSDLTAGVAQEDAQIQRVTFTADMTVPVYPRRTVAQRQARESLRKYHNDMRKLHYSSAMIYKNHWGFEHTPAVTPTTVAATVRPKVNTLCMPGHQFSAEAATGKHSFVRISKDHRGPYVYPGCGKVRTGLEISLRPPAYIGSGMSSSSFSSVLSAMG